jgi:hypothetical protein
MRHELSVTAYYEPLHSLSLQTVPSPSSAILSSRAAPDGTVLHATDYDPAPQHRVVRRCTVLGEA